MVRVVVRGPDDRRADHFAEVPDSSALHHAIGVAMELYRKFYPDAPIEMTVSIDPA